MRDEISLLEAQLTYKKRLEAMLAELRSQQSVLKEKVYRLEKQMQTEQKDMQRLEGHGLAVFFYHMAGRMEERLDTERREYYAARVKYETALRELKALDEDIEMTLEDLQDLADCEARYIRAMEEKRTAIKNAGTELSRELMEREQDLSFLHSQERELEEAIAAGTTALRVANDVVLSLKHVESVGLFDTLGGFLVDMARHETLDEAQKNVEQLQVCLQKFHKELADVALRENLQVGIDRLLRFADTFFDGLITDLTVLDNVKQSHTQVDQTRDNILGLLRQLQTRLEEVRHKQSIATAEVDAMIAGAEM